MNIDKKLLAQMRELCDEIAPEDGLSPAQLRRSRREARRTHRKDHQLCGQVARALNLALPAAGDPRLQGVIIHRVVLAPDAARLRAEYDPGGQPLGEVQAALEAARGWLRGEVARAIHRKRTPELRFAPADGAPEGGEVAP
jgi:ribosome-binding factor A